MSKNSTLSKIVSNNANVILFLDNLTIANSSGNVFNFSSNGVLSVAGTPITNSSGIVAAGGGATLVANTTDNQTFYFPMSNTTTGSWSNGVVDTNITFTPLTNMLSVGNTTSNVKVNNTSLVINGTSIGSGVLKLDTGTNYASINLYGGGYSSNLTQYGLYTNEVRTYSILSSNGDAGSAGQVLTSNGFAIYWSTPSAGGGGTLAIGNAVYLMWYASGPDTYYLARGWVYKSNKQTYPSFSTLYFRFYDSYSAASINPSWSTVKDAPSPSTWSLLYSGPSASSFASTVSMSQLYGLEFYSDYNFAGSEFIMPASPSSTSATPAGTLKYPSGGLGGGMQSVFSSFDSMTDATWGYAPNYYIYFDYYLDGTQDSKIASFNYP